MKHYFLVAKDVGDLTRIFCASLEAKEMKEAPVLRRHVRTLCRAPAAKAARLRRDFRIEANRLEHRR